MNIFNVLRFFRSARWFLAAFFVFFIALGYTDNAQAAHLTCGTTYYYRARSVDAASNTTTSSEKSFTTSACAAAGSGSGGTSGSGAGSTTPTNTTTSTAAPTTTTTTNTTGTTATGSTTTTGAKKTTTTATATKTTPAPGQVSATPSPTEATTGAPTSPLAGPAQALALPQSLSEYRSFYEAVSNITIEGLPPLPAPLPPPPTCQEDGNYALNATYLRGPEILANIIVRVIPDIPCGGVAQPPTEGPTDPDSDYCGSYQTSSRLTKLLVANPCKLKLDQIGEDTLDCYGDLFNHEPCMLGEGGGIGGQGGGELICPPPSSPVGSACVEGSGGGGEGGPIDCVDLPNHPGILEKLAKGLPTPGIVGECGGGDDCNQVPGGAPPSRPPPAIIAPEHRHKTDLELHVKAGATVLVGTEGGGFQSRSYLRTVADEPYNAKNISGSGGSDAQHTSIAEDSLFELANVEQPVRVTYTGVDEFSVGGACRGGSFESISIIVEPNPNLQIFKATPPDIPQGGASELSWNLVGGITSIELDGEAVGQSGQKLVQPSETTTYHLRFTTKPGSPQIEKTATVTVHTGEALCGDGKTWVKIDTFPSGCPPGPPGCDLPQTLNYGITASLITPHAHPSDPIVTITAGQPLTVAVENNDVFKQPNTLVRSKGYLRSSNDQPNLYKALSYLNKAGDGSHQFPVIDDGADFLAPGTKITKPTLVKYTSVVEVLGQGKLTNCLTANQQWFHAIEVLIVPAANGEPTITFTATPDVIAKGGQSTLEWTTTNAKKVTLNGVKVAASGSQVVSPAKTTDYQLVATKVSGGNVSRTVTVTVTDSLGDCLNQNQPFDLSQIKAAPAEPGPHPSPLTLTLSVGSTLQDPTQLAWWVTTDGQDPKIRAKDNPATPDAKGNQVTITLLPPGARVRAHLMATSPCNLQVSRSFDQNYEVIEKQGGGEGTGGGQTQLVVTITPNGGADLTDPVSVTLDAQVPPEQRTQLIMFYTGDPAIPDADLAQGKGVARYTQPIRVSATTELRAIAMLGSQKSAIVKTLFQFKQQTCKPAIICKIQGNFKLEITPNPEGKTFEGPTAFELKAIPKEHNILSLHLERGTIIPTQNSPKVPTKLTISERGTYTFKAFGSESDPLTVFIDMTQPPADPAAPSVAISPKPGTFSKPVRVVIKASGGSTPVTASYTTNGDDPLTAGILYQGPLTLTQSTLLKYVAKDSAGKVSPVGQAFYSIETAPGGGTGGGTVLLTWQPALAQVPEIEGTPLRYDVSCNGNPVGTVDQPIVSIPQGPEPCNYTVVAKAGDKEVATIPTVTPVAVAQAVNAKAKTPAGPPATPVEKATAVAETTVATT
ncbi:chitobiase/beta-hexosaminidase C-terminal domain-containing protein, partial [Candidatus Berkelbacteria bacterium]|nr:chitobiase/beta-hexosaminidase C-terminal domain-containing protein [Candidatus Berkelbacteria bacterium]